VLRSIVLPAYNESEYIGTMVSRVVAVGERRTDPFEVIVVDNASTDATATIVEAISKADERVRVVHHPENRLYAASCMTGTRTAIGDRIFILDSDGQYPPEHVWDLDTRLDAGADLVFGWRHQRHETRRRIAMSRVLLGMTRWYLKFPFHDINCGIRGFNRAFADQLDIRYRVNLVNPELYVRAVLGGFEMQEAPVVQEPRQGGTTSHNLGHLLQIFRDVNAYLADLRQELKSTKRVPDRGAR
jgi:glycosyltransferase involved in cell wall biosynthesis